jgi:glycosyltransferase involved in cell wall biosynthesis
MKEMKHPLVSVIIPTYKRPDCLRRSIDSVIDQTYNNLEIIVVNDDPSINLEEYLKYKKIIYINNDINLGSAGSRNKGIKVSSGKYVAFLDDDDIWLPTKIEEQVNIMETLTAEWVGVYTWCFYSKEKEYNSNKRLRVRKSPYEGNFSYEILSGANNLYIGAGSGLLVRSYSLKKIGGFDESFKRHTDYDLVIRLLQLGKIKLIKFPLWINFGGLNFSSVDEVEDAKLKLMIKFENYIKRLSQIKQNTIYAHQFLELSNLYILNLNFKKSIKYFIKSLYFFPTKLSLKRYLGPLEHLLKGIKKYYKL